MENKLSATETKVREILTEIVTPLMEQRNKEVDEKMTSEIDQRIKEMVAVEKTSRIEVHENFDDDKKGGFKSFSHFCRDVAICDKSAGRFMSNELAKWTSVKGAGTGLSEQDADYAGHLVPIEFRNTLMLAVEESNDLVPLMTPMPMASNIIKIPYVDGFDKSSGYVYGGVQWKWTAEEGAFSETRPKIQMLQLELHKATGLAYVTDELLADSPQSVEALLKNGFKDGLNFLYNEMAVHGTGAGQPLGYVNASCAVSVAIETGQTGTGILFENVVNMFSRSTNPGKAVWVTNSACLPTLATMSFAVGTGGVPVWMPAGGISGVPYNTLFGRPLYFNDHCSAPGTVGDIAFVDFSQILYAQKSGGDVPAFDTSIHLKFDYGGCI